MRRNHLRLASTAALALIALTACGGDDDADDGNPPPTGGDGAALVVDAKDSLEFDRERYQATAGEIPIEYVSVGSLPHTLVVEGHEGDLRLQVSDGSTDSGTIELPAGTYTLYCDIAGHKEAGMQATLVVE